MVSCNAARRQAAARLPDDDGRATAEPSAPLEIRTPVDPLQAATPHRADGSAAAAVSEISLVSGAWHALPLPEVLRRLSADEHGLSSQEAKQRVTEWFKRLDMWDWRGKKVEELSKGMQQKLQFVLTVIHNPKLIILDEPFTGFDPVNAEVIKQEILRLKEQGSTIILSTHRMESVEELCDDIVLINKSEVVLRGEVEEVRHRYKKNVFEVVYTGNPLSDVVGGQVLETQTLKNGQHRTTLRSEQDSPKQMLHGLIDQREVLAFKELIPSIKDIFIELVGGSI